MAIKNMTIRGIRSFRSEKNIEFAVPNGEIGSGLNIIVGSNNSGKSTIIESMNIVAGNSEFISSDVRNKNSDNFSKIYLELTSGNNYLMETIDEGAFAKRKYNGEEIKDHIYNILPIILLSTNRHFSHYFSNYISSQLDYINTINNQNYRDDTNNKYSNFGGRIIKIFKDDNSKQKYINEIKYIFNDIPNWTIDSRGNELEIVFPMNNSSHNSNGAGQGLNNLFVIVDSYLNFDLDTTIVIDEPEISLHPDIQRNLFERLMEVSKKKQVIITTHSPYFVNFSILKNGGKIFRIVKNDDCSDLYELNKEDYKVLSNYDSDNNNPHILLLEARETLFLHDNVILVEGQDDVIAYKKIFKKYKINNQVSFFGWGVGGYNNFYRILNIMQKLGYKRVFCIADGDNGSKEEINKLKKIYTSYKFYNIKAEDIKDKRNNDEETSIIRKIDSILETENKSNVELLIQIKKYLLKKIRKGLVNNIKDCEIKNEYLDDIKNLVYEIKRYFKINLVKDNNITNDNNNEITVTNIGNANSISPDKLRHKIEKKFNIKILASAGTSKICKINKDNYKYIEFYYLINNKKELEISNIIKIDLKNKNVIYKKVNIIKNELINDEINLNFFDDCYK